MTNRLAAELEVRPDRSARREDFVALGAIVNVGAERLLLNTAPLSSPSLALEVVDTNNAPVRMPPPGVPPLETPRLELDRGQRYLIEFANFFPQWEPAGVYRVRLRYRYRPANPLPDEWSGEVYSTWVQFTVLSS